MNEGAQLSHDESAELRELLDALCSDTMTDGQRDRLDALLRDKPQAQWFYLSYLNVHAQLHWELRSGLPDPATALRANSPVSPGTEPAWAKRSGRTRRHRARRVATGAALAVIAISGLIAILWKPWEGERDTAAGSPSVARLTDAAAARWSHQGPSPNVGDSLPRSELHLLEGLAEVELAGGAVVLLEGPARVELLGPERAFLHAGRLVARAEGEATGFVLETDRASLLDVGTEFGVEVGLSGTTVVQVFAGAVIATYGPKAGVPSASHHLSAGRACEIASGNGTRPRELEFAPRRFVRRLPKPDDRGGAPNRPYNQPRFDTVHIVPAPSDVTIDGDLADWDTSGMFRSECYEPYGDTYYVEAAMMYDDRALYIAAHVGDPSPLRNVIDPRVEPENGWRGDGVQLRISTDRTLTRPLAAVSADGALLEDRPLGPQDRNDRLVHLTMWRFEPEQQPCLYVEYGMDAEPMAVNPPGYRGAFRRDADGRGYTIEYAIDWDVLAAAEDPPRAGDELAAAWSVHWSDPGGRDWRGHLIEVVDAEETAPEKGMARWTFIRAATWGKAIFHPAGDLPAGTVKVTELQWD